MNRFWLTPVCKKFPLVLGGKRFCLEDTDELHEFREKLSRVHPRVLLLFKGELLLAESETNNMMNPSAVDDGKSRNTPGFVDLNVGTVCGASGERLPLANGKDIVFDGSPYSLSPCAEAFVLRMPDTETVLSWLSQSPGGWSVMQKNWIAQMREWLAQKREVILVREDGTP